VLGIVSFPAAFVAGINGPIDIEWAIVLAFLVSLALTWRVRDRKVPASAS
jgi:hypothetical protein